MQQANCKVMQRGLTMRDVAEARILVTGATDGLGRRVAQVVAAKGATMLLHGRNPERLKATLEELRIQPGSEKVSSYLADLSSLGAVRGLADRIHSEHDRLDVLVNNAGIIARERRESEDGYELTFAVNYLSHFLLTRLLLPLLKDSAPARIVNVASAGQSPLDFSNLMLERGYDAMKAYSQSKLAQVMFTFELADHLRGHRRDRERLAPGLLDGYQDGPEHLRLYHEHGRGGDGGRCPPGRLAGGRRDHRPLLRWNAADTRKPTGLQPTG